MSRDGQPAVTREEILAAAAHVFLREGYRGATMDLVARQVGLHKASLYHHIRSKESLLIALCDIALGTSLVDLQKIVDDSSLDPCVKVATAVRRHVQIFFEQPGASAAFTLFAHQIGDAKARDWYLAKRLEYAHLLQGLVQDALSVNECDDDPRLVTLAILGQCNWMQHWYRPNGPSGPDEIIESFSALALRAVGCCTAGHADRPE
jgi:TetR/AcrR family transcriptional regulator, cholesterol catabolism regulator